ncbi:phosphoglycerate dehydrogenase [Chloroflexota bacterium]
MKVLITDPISEEGIEGLRNIAQVDVKTELKPEEIIAIIGDYEALMVRSQTKVTAEMIEAGKKLQVIARAGVGIDNVDLETATRLGVLVVNAPTGNTVSAAEHAIALMMALARHIPQANAVLKSGKWQRSDYTGTELRAKTLGIIGLGNVGSEVARRALGLEMKILGHDPFVSVDHAGKIQVELVDLERLLKESDFISLHIPATAQTAGLIGEKELAMIKPTARIINCARGGLIDEEALTRAVREKRLAGAAIDVFKSEPITESVLFEENNIIVTPHLGASTAEAQVTAARDVADQIIDVFRGQPARYAVNVPFIPAETLTVLEPFVKAANVVGKLIRQLMEGQAKTVRITYSGEISNYDTNALKAAVLAGFLEGIIEERVNLVNANLIAAQRGLKVVEQKEPTCENHTSIVSAEVTTSAGTIDAAGTVINGEIHLVRVNNYWLDIVPTGDYFLFSDHLDRPGIVGAVGKILGDADVNISFMHVGRLKVRGHALMVLIMDEPLAEEQQQQILAIPDIYSIKLVQLLST